jgi:hypothetical protein
MTTIRERVNKLFEEYRVKLKAEELKFAEAPLEDGTIIYTDAEAWEAGVNVYIVDDEDNKIPVPVGEYKLADGRIVVIAEDGILAEIREMEAEVEVEQSTEPTMADILNAIAALDTKLSAQVKEGSEATTKLSKEVETIKANFSHKGLPKAPKKEQPAKPLSQMTAKERVNYLMNQ